jgi:hypothetical protein
MFIHGYVVILYVLYFSFLDRKKMQQIYMITILSTNNTEVSSCEIKRVVLYSYMKKTKRLFFRLSLVISGIAGIFLGTQQAKNNNTDITSNLLDSPIMSIEKAFAMDGGGDCCGSSSCDGGVAWPDTTSEGVVINMVKS